MRRPSRPSTRESTTSISCNECCSSARAPFTKSIDTILSTSSENGHGSFSYLTKPTESADIPVFADGHGGRS